ncbi:uncharacterized protein HRG_05043 [Hirsutella rhossiliensis]|uniref:Heterokaryon incompatibility domain-containing protein n=1 Tax=Hirsutella rhossiliensis TaxID=111463 RepID=A0A9P8N0F4_9HYPO|nr:uncharacterized protein HRG_05043 [Hirsutella rhossiliensis]KAH0964615.1 hypothetical protein HRG_05043 [Hirsutella rhossiliensis]
MDHLPFPQGAQPPKVPYVGTDFVDDGEFSRYPRRQGMETDLRTWTFTRLPPENYQAFFQTWLYFGCLSKVFQIVGLPINAGEFINRKEGIILGAIREVLDIMRNTLRGPLQAFRHFLAEQHPDGPVTASWPNIALSIGALGYTIRRVSDDLYAPARMERSHWCKALITKMLKGVEVDFLVFVGSIPFPRAFENHKECETTVCRGRIADSAQYQVAHASEPCAWSDHEGLQVVQYRENMPFVAISHVWSDGKGNPDRNALPRCQLQHIQAKVTELYSPVGFWMDTLCVPVAEEHKDLRSKAIKQMRAIYEAADRVLVLDNRVEQLAVSSSICDRAARLVVSNWQGRLWTLQEGIMAQQLFFQFSDGALALPELEEEEIRQRDKSRPSPGFWHRVSHGLLTLLSIGLIFGSEADVPGVDGLFEALMPVAKNRLTTNLDDETVCLATLLRLDPGPLLGIKRLLVGYPGIMLHSLDPSLIRAGRFYVREKAQKWFQYRVSLIARPEDTAQLDKLGDEGNRQALVMIAAPGDERDGPLAAVFGDLRGVSSDGVRQLRHLCLAKVEEDDEAEEERNNANGTCFGGGENDEDDEEEEEDEEDRDDGSDEEEVDYHGAEDDAEEDDQNGDNSDWADTNSDSDSEQMYKGAEPEEGEDAVGHGGQDGAKVCEDTDSDDESLLDSDADGEDDRYAALLRSNSKRVGLNGRDREQPRQEQVVFGKVLFSKNNKWCII